MRVGSGAGLLLVGLVATACSSGPVEPSEGTASTTAPSASSTGSPSAVPSAAPSASVPAPGLPPVKPWAAGRTELHPEVKEAATAYIEAAGTWDGSAGTAADVSRRVRTLGVSRAAAKDAARLADGDAVAATLDVIYPQFGGLAGTSASVMLLAEQILLADDGEKRTREMIFDVRIGRSGSTATVTGIEPPVIRRDGGQLSRAARAVLADDRIVLHAPAVADIRSGDTEDSILTVLTTLAESHTIEVLTLHTGHPHNVYDTDRTSNHTEGRAADIWRVDGQPVVRASHALLVSALTDAGAAGATEVGGPFDLNGRGPGYFTDETHSDHIHVGVSPGRPPAKP